MPALDGLRALAVGAVLAYHLGIGWAGGGYLGVDLFFVLSGFLITGLLAGEIGAHGRISVRGFWARRARRLLPALLVVLVALSVYAGLAGRAGGALNPALLRNDGLAALAYFANWHFLAAHQSYFSQFAAPSPLEHTWSLAIEEQFYILWPLLLAGVVAVTGRSWRKAALGVTVLLAWWSVASMALVSHGASDPSRAYFGTDSRAFELLVGAVLALLLANRPRWQPRRPAALHAGGAGSLVALGAGWSLLGGPPAWMFRGGLLAAAVLAAVLIASVSRPDRGPIGRLLSLGPMRWVGRISYGLYLWHWPLFALVRPHLRSWPAPAADVAPVAATFAVATASYYLIEMPIRRGAFSGWRRLVALPAAIGATAAAVLIASVPVAPAVAAAPPFPGEGAVAPGPAASPVTFGLPRVPTRSDPLRVLVIGDSVMDDAEPGLAALLQSTGVVRVTNTAAPWWGLTQSHWQTDWPALIARVRPEVVIGTWGWDLAQAQADPAAYGQLLDRAVSELLSPGDGVAGVVLLQYPRIGPHPGFDAATLANEETAREAWNGVAAAVAAARPGAVSYLAVAGALELHGRYATWLPGADGRWSRARMIDDVHPCPTGAARLASAVDGLIGPAWHLPGPAPGWWKGPWVHDPRYNDPLGSCPADHPPLGTPPA
jgi:peptidoglycan/LPS O-acetylase OafA/YrhL